MSLQARKNIVIPCEELDPFWDEHQLVELVRLWDEEYDLMQIAEYFQRHRKEIVIALLEVLKDQQMAELFGERWGTKNGRKSKFICMD